MQSERHREQFSVPSQDLSSARSVFHCEYLYLIDTDIHARTLTKQDEGLHAVAMPLIFWEWLDG